LLNRLPFCNMPAVEVAGAQAAATEEEGLEEEGPEEEREEVTVVAGPGVLVEGANRAVGRPVAEPPVAALVVQDITPASTVPTHSRGKLFPSFPLALLTTSKCCTNSPTVPGDLSS
jgi:hypothetical protein